MPTMHRRERARPEDGQILILFVLMVIVLILFAGLLFTGAQSLVLRRQMQNAGDSAALAAANLMGTSTGCSQDGSTTPRTAISTAAVSAVTAIIPGFSSSRIVVTCPTGYSNSAVQVELSGTTPAYFVNALPVSTSSTAFNGSIFTGAFAVALLDTSNPSWGNSRKGCPSYLVNGGPSVTYEGSLVVNSGCMLTTSNNGAFKATNNAFTMTMLNGASAMVFGQASAGSAAHITPPLTEGFRPALPDPLAGIVPPCHDVTDPTLSSCLGTTSTNGSLPTRGTLATNGQGGCKVSDPCPILPGTYRSMSVGTGQDAKTVLLRPGVYFIAGGGLSLGASARVISIPGPSAFCGKTVANPVGQLCTDTVAVGAYDPAKWTDAQIEAQWLRDCPDPITNSASSPCGALIYNAKSDGSSTWTTNGSADAISVGAGSILLLRAYDPATDSIVANRTLFTAYKNLAVWQARLPAPDAGLPQPVVGMSGGGCVTLSGTVYAAGAEVQFGGSSCGTGGGVDSQAVLQFIAWDLTLQGNNSFYFAYRRSAFATPTGYGLIK